jgi:hypothetical protein
VRVVRDPPARREACAGTGAERLLMLDAIFPAIALFGMANLAALIWQVQTRQAGLPALSIGTLMRRFRGMPNIFVIFTALVLAVMFGLLDFLIQTA